MKLKSLYIKKYKNLSGTYNFEKSNAYVALIGLNGSGKSNLLEAISIIFNSLINNNGAGVPFEYTIEFEIDGDTYIRGNRISKKNGVRFKANEMPLPSSVIACYSGEDRRLWTLAYEEYFLSYFNKAVKSSQYTPSLLYIDRSCWKIAFLSLVCSKDATITSFLKSTFNIDTPIDVDVNFTVDIRKRAAFKNHPALSWFERIYSVGSAKISGNLISSTDIVLSGRVIPDEQKAKYIFYYLYLLSQPEKRKKNKIERLIYDIEIDVKGIDFNDLSEGQKKLILIECVTKVLGDKNSLVLLDEPDAHTHIAMKKNILKLISEFEGQTIMTTHSPMFLNKRWDGFDENNIFYMHDGKIENTEPLKHLAELTDNEIDYFEGSFILSSKYILVVEGKYDDKYLRKAISIFEKSDSKYSKLNDVAIISANSASSAEVIYNQILSKCIAKIEKIVFLFDYDDGGWKDGWKKIDAISGGGLKIIPMFYQDCYPSVNYPTSDALISAANGGQKTIKPDKTYMVEDIFSESAYLSVITPVINSRKYKDFRNNSIGNKGTAIKDYIEKNYNTFPDTAFDGFKTVLDELMNVFNF